MAATRGRAFRLRNCRQHRKTKERLPRAAPTSLCSGNRMRGSAQARRLNRVSCTPLTVATRGKLPIHHLRQDNRPESFPSPSAMRNTALSPAAITEKNRTQSTTSQSQTTVESHGHSSKVSQAFAQLWLTFLEARH